MQIYKTAKPTTENKKLMGSILVHCINAYLRILMLFLLKRTSTNEVNRNINPWPYRYMVNTILVLALNFRATVTFSYFLYCFILVLQVLQFIGRCRLLSLDPHTYKLSFAYLYLAFFLVEILYIIGIILVYSGNVYSFSAQKLGSNIRLYGKWYIYNFRS